MEQSTYAEQIVKCKKNAKDLFLQILAVIASITVLAIVAFIPQMAALVPAIAVIVLLLTYILVRNMNVEFEYTVVSSEIQVDMIRGKSSRKRITTADVKTFEILSYVESKEQLRELKKGVQTVCSAAPDKNIDGCWYAIYSRGGEDGKTLLVFKPNSRVLNVILRYVPPRNVKMPVENIEVNK